MEKLSRRAFTLSLPVAAFSASTALSSRSSRVQAQKLTPDVVTPLAQIAIGRFTITALNDGYVDMPFNYFPGSTPQETERAAAALFAVKPGGIRFMFNQYLVSDGDSRILIDAGPAGTLGKSGYMPQALKSLGISADSIDAVIITHMHQDHLGGLVSGGRKNFPNADIYVDRRDLAYWTDPGKRAAAPDFLKASFDLSLDVVRLYPKLQVTDGERQITRGVSIVDLTGHTPGHIGVRVEDGGQSLIMVSDMLFPVVHPARSSTGFVFEQDPAAAQAMRARFFPRAAEEKALIAATHMPFPGLGRIVAADGGLRWLHAEWAHQG
ncbi:MAG: MBL fold metallo-hydrolase [Chitinophagales bacterium]|nr:MBL fold metallo-hydrolase [Hyphomicrobiales bacterium]